MTTDTLPDMAGHNCATGDPEAFFPVGANQEYHATILCLGCPWRAPCLDYALTHDVQGVWGGTTYQQRREHRQRHNISPLPVVA